MNSHSRTRIPDASTERQGSDTGTLDNGDQRTHGNGSVNDSQHPSSPSSLGSSGIDWSSCGGFVVWALETWWDWTLACLELWWHLLVASNLKGRGLYRLSNLMLGWHFLGVWIAHTWLAEQRDGVVVDIHTIVLKILIPLSAQDRGSNSLWDDPTFVLWTVPLAMGFFSALVDVSSLIRIPNGLQQAPVVLTLGLLDFLESLLSFYLQACFVLCISDRLSWVEGALIVAFAWNVIFLSIYWIRCLVYQNMGHG